jgi:hypothetical protein
MRNNRSGARAFSWELVRPIRKFWVQEAAGSNRLPGSISKSAH